MEKTLNQLSKKLNTVSDNCINSLEDIVPTMDKIEKDMLWDKVCSLERKMNKIIEMLGDRNAKN